MNIIKKQLNIIFDLSCIICGSRNLSDRIDFVCEKCIEAFDEKYENTCGICGHPLKSDKSCPSCPDLGVIYYDSYKYLQLYTGVFKKVIRMWKMNDNFMINRLYYELLINKKILDKNIPVTVVPDDFFKKMKKGRCGLSYLLKLLKNSGFMVDDGVIKKRIRFAGSQKTRNRFQRKNVETLFYKNEKNVQKHSGEIYLIDDIYTTGSTLNYCSKLLKQCGFEKVHAISFFRSSLFDRE